MSRMLIPYTCCSDVPEMNVAVVRHIRVDISEWAVDVPVLKHTSLHVLRELNSLASRRFGPSSCRSSRPNLNTGILVSTALARLDVLPIANSHSDPDAAHTSRSLVLDLSTLVLMSPVWTTPCGAPNPHSLSTQLHECARKVAPNIGVCVAATPVRIGCQSVEHVQRSASCRLGQVQRDFFLWGTNTTVLTVSTSSSTPVGVLVGSTSVFHPHELLIICNPRPFISPLHEDMCQNRRGRNSCRMTTRAVPFMPDAVCGYTRLVMTDMQG